MMSGTPTAGRLSSLSSYIQIARFDHWIKNIFMLPGFLAALLYNGAGSNWAHILAILPAGLLVLGFCASANYTINEYLDSEFDTYHPLKKSRPGARGALDPRLVYLQYAILAILGLGGSWMLGVPAFLAGASLLIMGYFYNVKPFRTKDRVFVDVLSESINNPIRFIFGWYLVDPGFFPPSSILLSYWMGGAFLMAMKRYAEYRDIGDAALAGSYRRSFRFYNEESLLVSSVFYAFNSTFFLAIFLIKYRIEYLFTFPVVSMLFAYYVHLSLKPKSSAQAPEKLYRERGLSVILLVLLAVFAVFTFVDVPALNLFLEPAGR